MAESAERPNPPDDSQSIRLKTPDGFELETVYFQPTATPHDRPALLMLHGFPSGQIPASRAGADLAELGQRLCNIGWSVLIPRMRGCGTSGGDFSLRAWAADARLARRKLAELSGATNTSLVGFGTGAALGLSLAAQDETIGAVATLGCPADFSLWAQQPDRLLQHARESGVISTPGFPTDEAAWRAELRELASDRSAAAICDRPLIVIHGTEDERVPQIEARLIADSHGQADLRVLRGADHQLRHDPRAVALLVGWLERHRAACT